MSFPLVVYPIAEFSVIISYGASKIDCATTRYSGCRIRDSLLVVKPHDRGNVIIMQLTWRNVMQILVDGCSGFSDNKLDGFGLTSQGQGLKLSAQSMTRIERLMASKVHCPVLILLKQLKRSPSCEISMKCDLHMSQNCEPQKNKSQVIININHRVSHKLLISAKFIWLMPLKQLSKEDQQDTSVSWLGSFWSQVFTALTITPTRCNVCLGATVLVCTIYSIVLLNYLTE